MATPCSPFLAGYPGTAWSLKLGRDRSLRCRVSVPLSPNNFQNVRYWNKASLVPYWCDVR